MKLSQTYIFHKLIINYGIRRLSVYFEKSGGSPLVKYTFAILK